MTDQNGMTPAKARKLAIAIKSKTDPNSKAERHTHKMAAANALEEWADDKEAENQRNLTEGAK